MSRPPYLVPGIPEGREDEDVRCLVRLVADLSRYAVGRVPTEAELASAPVMDRWRLVADPTARRILGHACGHPTARGPHTASSQVYAVDPAGRWARTYTRLWRLGTAEFDPDR